MKFENGVLDTLQVFDNSDYSLDILLSAYNYEDFAFFKKEELLFNMPSGEEARGVDEIHGGYSVYRSVYFNRNDSLVIVHIKDIESGEWLGKGGRFVLDFPFEGLNYFRNEGE
jgi:hypothetical protein